LLKAIIVKLSTYRKKKPPLLLINSGKNFTKGTLAKKRRNCLCCSQAQAKILLKALLLKKKKLLLQIISSGKNFTKGTLAKKEETAFAAH
jgi:hypothetical protein